MIQSALIGYIQSVPTTISFADKTSIIIRKAMNKEEIALLEGGEYTREQVAQASITVAFKYFSVLMKTGQWEFTPHEKCPQEFIDYMKAVKEAVK